MAGMSDFRDRVREAWIEDHERQPTWIEEILIDTYAEASEAAMSRFLGDTTHWQPTGFLGAGKGDAFVEPVRDVSPVAEFLNRPRYWTAPPPALRGPAAAPDRGRHADTATAHGTDADRVARELVPLVRAAADEVPVGDVPRLNEDFARLRFYTSHSTPDLNAAAERTHQELLDEYVRSLTSPWTTGCLTANDLRTATDKAAHP
jgi:hypothetical protein